MAGPLEGVKVLDLTQIVSGPMAAMVLADQGADVIKIEALGDLDASRLMGHQAGAEVRELGSMFAMVNRGKRSLVLDLKNPKGHSLFLQLVAKADVVMQNFRPGAVERLGIAYEDCVKTNPDIVYVSISGFGEVGPRVGERIYDSIIQGAGGVTAGDIDYTGQPDQVQFVICDKLTALTASQAITAALFARAQKRGGQHVRLSMLDSTIQFQWVDVFVNQTFDESNAQRGPDAVRTNLLQCSDGKIIGTFLQDKEFFGACRAVGHPEWCDDPRFESIITRGQHVQLLVDMFAPLLLASTCEDMLQRLRAEGVPCGPVLDRWGVIKSEQVRASGSLLEIPHPVAGTQRTPRPAARFSGTPSRAPVYAPMPGEHTAGLLETELGLSKTDVEDLVKDGVIAVASARSKL